MFGVTAVATLFKRLGLFVAARAEDGGISTTEELVGSSPLRSLNSRGAERYRFVVKYRLYDL